MFLEPPKVRMVVLSRDVDIACWRCERRRSGMSIQPPSWLAYIPPLWGCAWVRSGIPITHLSAKVPGRGWEVWDLIGPPTVFEIR